jgi:glucuronate isomerase
MSGKALVARPRKARGPDRPRYFDASDVDRVMAVLLALTSEVAALRERLDTHERVAAQDALPSPARVEAYRPDSAVEEDREAWRDAYVRRLFRVITEDVEALRQGGKPK